MSQPIVMRAEETHTALTNHFVDRARRYADLSSGTYIGHGEFYELGVTLGTPGGGTETLS